MRHFSPRPCSSPASSAILRGGITSDAILRRTGDPQAARRNVIVGAMVGAGICLGLVFTTANLTLDALFLASGFFCLELVIGPIWSIPMDIAPQYAGTGSGLMNTGSAVAAIVSPLAFGLIVDLTGSWVLPFAVSIALLLRVAEWPSRCTLSAALRRRRQGRRRWSPNSLLTLQHANEASRQTHEAFCVAPVADSPLEGDAGCIIVRPRP
jgi:MFS family permease